MLTVQSDQLKGLPYPPHPPGPTVLLAYFFSDHSRVHVSSYGLVCCRECNRHLTKVGSSSNCSSCRCVWCAFLWACSDPSSVMRAGSFGDISYRYCCMEERGSLLCWGRGQWCPLYCDDVGGENTCAVRDVYGTVCRFLRL